MEGGRSSREVGPGGGCYQEGGRSNRERWREVISREEVIRRVVIVGEGLKVGNDDCEIR